MRRLPLLLLFLSAACSETAGPGGDAAPDGGVIFWRFSDGSADLGPDLGPGDVGSPDGGGSGPSDLGPADDGGPSSDLGPEGCDAPAEAVVTASIAAAGGALVDAVVEVAGALQSGPTTCSGETCSVEDPCCQSCRADVRLDGVLDLRSSACTPFSAGCRGSNCSLTCSPPLLGIPVRFRGRVLEDGALEVLERLP